jgi:hypothetical protein
VYGHEGAGVVEKVGSQVAKLKAGDHVVMSFNSCGVCVPCKKGEISYCVDHFASNFSFARFSDKSKTMRKGDEVVHGAFFNQPSFASHALGNERTVVKIPSDVPLEMMGPLGCGIQTGAGAVLNSHLPFSSIRTELNHVSRCLRVVVLWPMQRRRQVDVGPTLHSRQADGNPVAREDAGPFRLASAFITRS